MKEIFESLTRLEYESLRRHCLSLGMHPRVFTDLKKRKDVTASFMNILYDACGISYDYRTGVISRLAGISQYTPEEIDQELDKYL